MINHKIYPKLHTNKNMRSYQGSLLTFSGFAHVSRFPLWNAETPIIGLEERKLMGKVIEIPGVEEVSLSSTDYPIQGVTVTKARLHKWSTIETELEAIFRELGYGDLDGEEDCGPETTAFTVEELDEHIIIHTTVLLYRGKTTLAFRPTWKSYDEKFVAEKIEQMGEECFHLMQGIFSILDAGQAYSIIIRNYGLLIEKNNGDRMSPQQRQRLTELIASFHQAAAAA